MKIAQDRRASDKSITLIVDSTGLKIHDGCGWHEEKHGTRKVRKTWRKLHIALDPDTGASAAAELIAEHVGDETALRDLLASIESDVAQFLADGAYGGPGVADCLVDKFGPEIEIIIPPPKNAVPGANIQRNQHIDAVAEHGRMKWQSQTGYNQRSRVEAQIASKALNRMTALGRAAYERVF
ncbi:transposase [Sedimentitalea sp.]|uniref:transposase n=1 Tax=Sedimentitalea sp. TaxID=2048915 RepID=UPI0032973A24